MNLKYETIESNVITLPTQESHARKALRLLVIEDSSQDYELLHAFLSDSGYELRGRRVETESELRAALQEGEWDLIVSDDNLPCFSAESALRVVRSLDPNMPFIIVSGSIQEEKAIAAMLAGADDYISKRRMGRLVPAVDRSLRTADARRRRHAAEIALRDNEHRLRALAANIPGMLFELRARRDGIRFTYISEGSLALLGLAPAALLDAPETLLERFEQQDRERLL
ncbi:MAG: response regulator, partial [Burkholderiales bacterium]|nr:response regulator [Burkholderiales bacterium]